MLNIEYELLLFNEQYRLMSIVSDETKCQHPWNNKLDWVYIHNTVQTQTHVYTDCIQLNNLIMVILQPFC